MKLLYKGSYLLSSKILVG